MRVHALRTSSICPLFPPSGFAHQSTPLTQFLACVLETSSLSSGHETLLRSFEKLHHIASLTQVDTLRHGHTRPYKPLVHLSSSISVTVRLHTYGTRDRNDTPSVSPRRVNIVQTKPFPHSSQCGSEISPSSSWHEIRHCTTPKANCSPSHVHSRHISEDNGKIVRICSSFIKSLNNSGHHACTYAWAPSLEGHHRDSVPQGALISLEHR